MKHLLAFAALLLACSGPQERLVSVNAKSACTGNRDLQKISADADGLSCAKALQWSYNAQTRVLSLVQTGIGPINCDDKVSLRVLKDGEKFVVNVQIKNGAPVDCMCVFEASCDLVDVGGTVLLEVYGRPNLIVLDSNADGTICADAGT